MPLKVFITVPKRRGHVMPCRPTWGRSPSSAGRNRCLDAAEACTADARCQRLRTEYVAQCLGRAAPGGCPRARCRRALRRFFARGPPALTHALLFCPCANAACAERRRQTFVPACAFSGPGPAPPSCLAPLDACEHSRICRPRLLAFQASCAPAPSAPDGCLLDQAPRCLRAYAGLVGTDVTPNYVDNASARVAPWCDCGASGNRREECEAFRGLFTRNRCLDGAIQAFDGGRPPILQDHLCTRAEPSFCLKWAPGWELPALHAPCPGSPTPALRQPTLDNNVTAPSCVGYRAHLHPAALLKVDWLASQADISALALLPFLGLDTLYACPLKLGM
uniref:GDNF family receptor alpha 4 n=1 Tax=Ursus americanus TaxID=9643 RepID=A0A452SRG1_URSAM